MSRFARKVDANQGAIATALRNAGCVVVDLSWCGRGVPDLHVVRAGRLYWLEVKRERPVNSKAKDDRTGAELEWARVVPTQVVRTPEDALRAVGLEIVK